MTKIKLSKLKYNPDNPRSISPAKLKKLMNSIVENEKMMSLRPMIVDADFMVLGGNQRLTALKALKYKDIPEEWVKVAADLTKEERRRFIITDNISFGEWEQETLKMQYSLDELEWFGLDNLDWSLDEQEPKPKAKTKQDSALMTCPHCGEQFEV